MNTLTLHALHLIRLNTKQKNKIIIQRIKILTQLPEQLFRQSQQQTRTTRDHMWHWLAPVLNQSLDGKHERRAQRDGLNEQEDNTPFVFTRSRVIQGHSCSFWPIYTFIHTHIEKCVYILIYIYKFYIYYTYFKFLILVKCIVFLINVLIKLAFMLSLAYWCHWSFASVWTDVHRPIKLI